MFDLLRRECARTVNTVCFIIFLLCAAATREYYCLTRLWISSFTVLCAALWLNVEQYIIYKRARADKLPAASLPIDLSFQIEIKKQTGGARSFTMSAEKITPSPFLLEALTDPRASFLLAGEVVCQRPIPSGALLDLGVSSAVHRAHFPELHSFMMSESIQRKKKRCLLSSIQQPRPLISAGTVHNEKGRPALTSSSGLCNKGPMTIHNFSCYNVDCLIFKTFKTLQIPQMFSSHIPLS